MNILTDFSSSIVEFKSTLKDNKSTNLVDGWTETDFVQLKKNASTETNQKVSIGLQVQPFFAVDTKVDLVKLSAWLKKIYPSLEAELLKGPTSLPHNSATKNDDFYGRRPHIQTYQKIFLGPGDRNKQGLATWLAVHTNNVPALVVTTPATHEEWCEHTDQSLTLFIPKRVQEKGFVVFTEIKKFSLKACLSSLCTNAFNKNMFAGSTVAGDIYVWLYTSQGPAATIEIVELFSKNSHHGCATAIDWAAENRLVTCHANGSMEVWLIENQMELEKSFFIKIENSGSHNLTAMLAISTSEFVVGTNDGGVYHCCISNVASKQTEIVIGNLRRHPFVVSTLLKRNISGQVFIVSADISGQVCYHNLQNSNEDGASLIVKFPLPFRNAITCSPDGNIIYSPGTDGSLDCYRVQNAEQFSIKGALQGKGHFIKCCDNGLWIITGLYGGEFQIFTVELD